MDETKLPKPLRDVVDELAALPGLGPKSALRAALTLLKWPKARTGALGLAIHELRDRLHLCGRCLSLSETDPCSLCADPGRRADQLCLVSEWDSLLALEEAGQFTGLYFVLGGLLAPLDGVGADNLEAGRLRARLAEGEVTEIILALGTTLEAEATASFIKNLVVRDFARVRVTRLAQGIPLGSEVKFIDKETLRQSLRYRQDLDQA
ncbi:MAG: recombination protein RecR [Desulfovibrionaceae bacterium]|nr:recombination protein RecR [Desulfovibrionaceae bacterium]